MGTPEDALEGIDLEESDNDNNDNNDNDGDDGDDDKPKTDIYERKEAAPFKHKKGRHPQRIWDSFQRWKYTLIDRNNLYRRVPGSNIKYKAECLKCGNLCSGTFQIMNNHIRRCPMILDKALKQWAETNYIEKFKKPPKKDKSSPEYEVCKICLNIYIYLY